jgi:hypothetical protein
MYNCEHEIEYPDDKYIQYFLWRDFFHDATIEMIQFHSSLESIPHKPGLSLTLRPLIDGKKEYRYLLNFIGCEYFVQEKAGVWNEYLNGRFKQTALLEDINQQSGKKNYHFRIQTADGYMDIIFSKFTIKKVNGRIRIHGLENPDYYHLPWLKTYGNGALQNPDGFLDHKKVLELANTGDDLERHHALYYLLKNTEVILIDCARQIVQLDWDNYEMSKILAILIIGIQGDEQDLQYLYSEYYDPESHINKYALISGPLPKRHIMDAIDKIIFRQIKAGKPVDAGYMASAIK